MNISKQLHIVRVNRSILGHRSSVFAFVKHFQATTIQCHIHEQKSANVWYTPVNPNQFILLPEIKKIEISESDFTNVVDVIDGIDGIDGIDAIEASESIVDGNAKVIEAIEAVEAYVKSFEIKQPPISHVPVSSCFVDTVQSDEFLNDMILKNITVRLIDDIKEIDVNTYSLESSSGFEPHLNADAMLIHLETSWRDV